MNLIHLKYALEVARLGSLNKASESLLIAQPNLSRAIKELESETGVTIFKRTPRGMVPTLEGERFLNRAAYIQKQVSDFENSFREGHEPKRSFSVSVPRATYIADGFSEFCKSLGREPIEVLYRETNASETLQGVASSEYSLGIVRYAQHFDRYFRSLFDEKEIECRQVSEFRYMLLMSRECPLAKRSVVHYTDLEAYIEIAHSDPYVPFISFSEVRREELPDNINRRIFVFERASQLELLAAAPETFMWVSPMPEMTLKRFGLVQVPCIDNKRVYRDTLIYRSAYKLTALDRRFIEEVSKSREKCFGK